MEAKMASSSSLHVLECTRFDLQLKKSLLPNDTRLPGYVPSRGGGLGTRLEYK